MLFYNNYFNYYLEFQKKEYQDILQSQLIQNQTNLKRFFNLQSANNKKQRQTMFEKIIHNYPYEGTIQQRQKVIREIFDEGKKIQTIVILKDLTSCYDKVIHILQNHPKVVVQLIFEKLSVQECLRMIDSSQDTPLQKQQNGFIKLLNDIGVHTKANQDQQFMEWFCKMYTKYSSIQKILVFIRELSFNYQHKLKDEFYPQFLADFIKGSALAIEAYLKLKAQSPKFDVDYIQHGQRIIKSTEKWVKDFYVQLLKNMRTFLPQNQLRISVLNAICDIVGALMQVQRQGNIQKENCEQILTECYLYVRKITTIQQFNRIYLNHLRKKNFHVAHHKIVIPEVYTSNEITFPKQAFGFILYKFLEQSQYIYSDQKVINFLIPIVNQLAQFQYEIKSQIQSLFIQKFKLRQLKFGHCFQGQFPLSILWFNLRHFQAKRNKQFLQYIENVFQELRTTSPHTYVNSLKILTHLHIQNLENEVNQFIGQKSLEVSQSHPQLLLILLKQVSWKDVNQKGEKVWRFVVENISQKNELRGKAASILESKNKEQKIAFVKELTKIVSI